MPEIKINPLLNVHQNYNKVMLVNPYRFGGGGASYEPETVAYMASVGIADDATVYYSGTPQQKTGNGFYVAIDNFIKSLKSEGVYSKLKAVYPMIGGNASTHKWNLINPQDTDAAFRILWYGSGVHSATGWKNDAASHGDTRLAHNQLILGSESLGAYSRTNVTESKYDIGIEGTNPTNIVIKYSGGFYSKSQNSAEQIEINSDSLGFYSLSRTSLSEYRKQKNASINTHTVSANITISNLNFYVGARNAGGGGSLQTTREYAYAFIGEGLTQTQMTAHYNAVQQLQTDLGRQV